MEVITTVALTKEEVHSAIEMYLESVGYKAQNIKFELKESHPLSNKPDWEPCIEKAIVEVQKYSK